MPVLLHGNNDFLLEWIYRLPITLSAARTTFRSLSKSGTCTSRPWTHARKQTRARECAGRQTRAHAPGNTHTKLRSRRYTVTGGQRVRHSSPIKTSPLDGIVIQYAVKPNRGQQSAMFCLTTRRTSVNSPHKSHDRNLWSLGRRLAPEFGHSSSVYRHFSPLTCRARPAPSEPYSDSGYEPSGRSQPLAPCQRLAPARRNRSKTERKCSKMHSPRMAGRLRVILGIKSLSLSPVPGSFTAQRWR